VPSGSYYPFPDAKDLVDFQKNGLLPKKLPSYNVPIKEYIKGYSLWLIILSLVVYGMANEKIKQWRVERNT
jgi:hypothetical protein